VTGPDQRPQQASIALRQGFCSACHRRPANLGDRKTKSTPWLEGGKVSPPATVRLCAERATRLDARACAPGARRRVENGADKAAVLDRLVAAAPGGREHGAGAAGLAVYVGDSASDLAPLLAADLGVVVGGNALLRRVAAAGGVRLRPLAAGALARARGGAAAECADVLVRFLRVQSAVTRRRPSSD